MARRIRWLVRYSHFQIWQYWSNHITIWRATIDPLIIGVLKKSWDEFMSEDHIVKVMQLRMGCMQTGGTQGPK